MSEIQAFDSVNNVTLKANEYICEHCAVHFYASKKPTLSPCCRRKLTAATRTLDEIESNKRKIIEAQASNTPLYNNTQAAAHIAKSACWTTDELAKTIGLSENVAQQIVKSYYRHIISFSKLTKVIKKADWKLYARDESGDEFELKL